MGLKSEQRASKGRPRILLIMVAAAVGVLAVNLWLLLAPSSRELRSTAVSTSGPGESPRIPAPGSEEERVADEWMDFLLALRSLAEQDEAALQRDVVRLRRGIAAFLDLLGREEAVIHRALASLEGDQVRRVAAIQRSLGSRGDPLDLDLGELEGQLRDLAGGEAVSVSDELPPPWVDLEEFSQGLLDLEGRGALELSPRQWRDLVALLARGEALQAAAEKGGEGENHWDWYLPALDRDVLSRLWELLTREQAERLREAVRQRWGRGDTASAEAPRRLLERAQERSGLAPAEATGGEVAVSPPVSLGFEAPSLALALVEGVRQGGVVLSAEQARKVIPPLLQGLDIHRRMQARLKRIQESMSSQLKVVCGQEVARIGEELERYREWEDREAELARAVLQELVRRSETGAAGLLAGRPGKSR